MYRGQVKGSDPLRRVVRAVSSARTPIAVAAVALAVAGLAFYIAAGSGLVGTQASTAGAPATAPHSTGAPTPGGHRTSTPAASPTPSTSPTTTPSPAQLAANTGTAPGTESGQSHPSPVRKKKHEPKPPSKPTRHRTSTTLAASPSPAIVGAKVTLTATEKASGGGHPAGRVQFEVGGSDLGSPVAVDADGVATMTTTFAAAGKESLSAEFTPTSAKYASSKGTFSLVVHPVPATVAGVVAISVMVPRTGTFTVTIHPGPVQLTPSGSIATGRLPDVTVTDTRNYKPGWSLSGQASRFTYSRTGKSVSGTQLGWVPTVVGSLHDGAKLGHRVTAGRPGLGSAPATLAYAPAGCGSGKNVFSASLTLNIPRSDDDGRYSGTVTITYVESAPAPADDSHARCSTPSGDR